MLEEAKSAPARVALIRELSAAGLLSETAAGAALERVRPAGAWWRWASRTLLFVGAALLLAGVIFFFAFNWAEMGKFIKLGLLEVGVAGAVLAGWRLGLERLSAKVLLLAASVLCGALLAVYGQTYQTGADAYELFVGWAGLIFIFVVAARFGGLWMMWLVIVNVGVALWWDQVLEPNRHVNDETLLLGLALLDAVALAAREIGAGKGLEWLAERWTRYVLLTAVAVGLLVPTIEAIVEPATAHVNNLVAAALAVALIVGGHYLYRDVIPDLAAIGLLVMSACALLLVLAGKILFEATNDEFALFFSMSVTTLAVTGAGVFWLRFLARTMRGRSDE